MIDLSGTTVLFAHPIADRYGSDRQLAESVRAIRAAGATVSVSVPEPGPLTADLLRDGVEVMFMRCPVIRRSVLTPLGIFGFLVESLRFTFTVIKFFRSARPDVVYVNTITIPTWLIVARILNIRAVCHVHEAEHHRNRLVGAALYAPLALATAVIVNSAASADCVREAHPRLMRRTRIIYNGIATSVKPGGVRHPRHNPHVVCVGRLSPRKGIDIALDAIALVRSAGVDARLTVAGTCFSGYEWFEEELHRRADRPDLVGSVTFAGYVDDVEGLLESADVAIVPSRLEPFGNTAVEAQLSGVPVVAARVQGLTEIVSDTGGYLVEPNNPDGIAAAILDIVANPERAAQRALHAQQQAASRFGVQQYRTAVVDTIRGVAMR